MNDFLNVENILIFKEFISFDDRSIARETRV